MISTLDRLARQLSESVQEDPATGVFRCRRDIFTDAELFALEMKHIFERGWVYLAHESQVPSAQERATRIRQYEDFFNVSGMGTPDDLEEFRACHTGYQGATNLWNDLSRGAKQWIEGADDNARAMGMNPQLSGVKTEDEGLFVRQHAHWAASLKKAIEIEQQGLIATDKEARP